jgi:hypothetical protein
LSAGLPTPVIGRKNAREAFPLVFVALVNCSDAQVNVGALCETLKEKREWLDRALSISVRYEKVLLGSDALFLLIKFSSGLGAKRTRHFVDPRNLPAPLRTRGRTITRRADFGPRFMDLAGDPTKVRDLL